MPIKDDERARIFMPFNALRGFDEAIRKKERIVVKPKILSDDEKDDINYKLKQIKKHMIIEIIYNDNNECVKVKGIVSKIDFDNKYLVIVKNKILFDTIVDINSENIKSLTDLY